jgi:hypothetical protein
MMPNLPWTQPSLKPLYTVKIWQSELADYQVIEVYSNEHARQIMDTYLAVGWWAMDWIDYGTANLIAKVRYNSDDPLDPRILEIINGNTSA